ncbi:MAG: phosphodiester glycosidase family protein [Parachlamydiaceae bacterium]|nr:phosphodiester glycosidase family protein [Parachlamydiaceae bacterium]
MRKTYSLLTTLIFYFFSNDAFCIELPQGLTYSSMSFDGISIAHILDIDPQFFNIIPGQSENFQLEHVASIAKRHHAIAAVNGGFFTVWGDYGDLPLGILKIAGDWRATPTKSTAAIGWSNSSNKVLFDEVTTSIEGTIRKHVFTIDGINTPCERNQVILYNWFYRKSTETKRLGIEFIIQAEKVLRINSCNSPLKHSEMVISVGRKKCNQFLHCKKGYDFNWKIEVRGQSTSPDEWAQVSHIMGAGPLLICNGQSIIDLSTLFSFYPLSLGHLQKARTAVGILSNGHWVFVVVDGQRNLNIKGNFGITLLEFADLMLQIGCVHAINFDGGGSSIMLINDMIVSTPCGELKDPDTGHILRKVSDAILVIPK